MSTPETLIRSGYEARKEGRLDDAKRLFAEAVDSCRETSAQPALARSLTGLGQIERDLGNSGAALQHYEVAANMYRSLGDPLRIAHTVRHVADILRHRGSIEPARTAYEEALKIYREHNDRSNLDLANALRGFAVLREEAGETKEAKQLWREARALYEAAGVHAGVQESDAHLQSPASA